MKEYANLAALPDPSRYCTDLKLLARPCLALEVVTFSLPEPNQRTFSTEKRRSTCLTVAHAAASKPQAVDRKTARTATKFSELQDLKQT